MKKTIRKLRKDLKNLEIPRFKDELECKLNEISIKSKQLDEKQAELSSEQIERDSLVEFNSQSYASFYNTKLEKDKSLLTLSVAGLGFLITYIGVSGITSYFTYILFIVGALSFLLCIYAVVNIFDENGEYIIHLTTSNAGHEVKEYQLKKLDKMAIRSFYFGLLTSFIIGASAPILNIGKEDNVPNSEDNGKQRQTNESFDGAAMLKKSFSDAGKLKPSAGSNNAGNGAGTATATTNSAQGVKK